MAALLDDETIAPILYPLDESGEEYDYLAWADTYIFGAGLAGDWFELAGKHADDLSELLEPMFLLNGMLKEDVEKSGERWFSPAEEARLVADIQENLPLIVQTLYNFWRNRRSGVTVQLMCSSSPSPRLSSMTMRMPVRSLSSRRSAMPSIFFSWTSSAIFSCRVFLLT